MMDLCPGVRFTWHRNSKKTALACTGTSGLGLTGYTKNTWDQMGKNNQDREKYETRGTQ